MSFTVQGIRIPDSQMARDATIDSRYRIRPVIQPFQPGLLLGGISWQAA